MKRMNLAQCDAVIILTAEEMNMKPAYTDHARMALCNEPVHITMKAMMNREAANINNRLRHDPNLIAQANLISMRIIQERGFGLAPEEPVSEQEDEDATDVPR